ncbi:putative asparagine synthetase [glutamine-hydrolyzing] [compost metagenome]
MGDMVMDQIKSSGIEDYIDIAAVEKMLQKHRNGQGDYARRLWTLYIFALWHKTFMEELPKKVLTTY